MPIQKSKTEALAVGCEDCRHRPSLILTVTRLPVARAHGRAKIYSFSNTSDRIFRPCRISGLGRGLRGGFLYTPQMVVADLLEQLADAGAADVVGLG